MIYVNRSAYQRAQENLRTGVWRIDHEAGQVIGPRGKPLRSTSQEGYILCRLTENQKVMAHRVIWEAHSGEPIPDGLEVNHINGRKDDNRLSNLELVTHTQNMRHAIETGLMPLPFGAKAWLTPEQKRLQRNLPKSQRAAKKPARTQCQHHGLSDWVDRATRPGTGYCRACTRERDRARRARRLQGVG